MKKRRGKFSPPLLDDLYDNMAEVVSFDLFWMRAKILDKAKGPEREVAPGLCLVDKTKRVESFSLIFEVLDLFIWCR